MHCGIPCTELVQRIGTSEQQGEREGRIRQEYWHRWSVCGGAGVLHRMDDGEMIRIMKPEADGGGAPSVCYRPTELMMDLLCRPLKGEETKEENMGGVPGRRAWFHKCWLVKMAAGMLRAWEDWWDEAELTSRPLFNPPPSCSGIQVALPFRSFHPDLNADIVTRRRGVFRTVSRAWRSRHTAALSQAIINVCRRDGGRKEK